MVRVYLEFMRLSNKNVLNTVLKGSGVKRGHSVVKQHSRMLTLAAANTDICSIGLFVCNQVCSIHKEITRF